MPDLKGGGRVLLDEVNHFVEGSFRSAGLE